jgi:hypothetical protein
MYFLSAWNSSAVVGSREKLNKIIVIAHISATK